VGCISIHCNSLKKAAEALMVLDKIIKLTSHQTGTDITKLARWLRCLFNLALTHDESISSRCIDHAIKVATHHHGVSQTSRDIPHQAIVKPTQDFPMINAFATITPPPYPDPVEFEDNEDSANDEIKEAGRYPPTELEWLATSTFNHAIDYYLQENDKMCTKWAEQAFVLASWLEDDGRLRDLLMEKYASLGLSNRHE
jgi:hypothetical protein